MRVISSICLLLALGACATSPQESKKLTATERARLLVDMANSSLLDGDATTCLVHLMNAEAVDPNLPELHHTKALAYAMKKDNVTALMEARKAVKLKPDYAEANTTLGTLLSDAGRYEEARGYLLRAASDAFYRDAYKPYTSLGLMELKQGRADAARDRFTQAIDSAPTIACIAYANRAQIDLNRGRIGDATRDFEQSTQKLCANYTGGQMGLAIAYEKAKRFDLARRKLLEIGNRFPNTQLAEQAMDRLRYIP